MADKKLKVLVDCVKAPVCDNAALFQAWVRDTKAIIELHTDEGFAADPRAVLWALLDLQNKTKDERLQLAISSAVAVGNLPNATWAEMTQRINSHLGLENDRSLRAPADLLRLRVRDDPRAHLRSFESTMRRLGKLPEKDSPYLYLATAILLESFGSADLARKVRSSISETSSWADVIGLVSREVEII